MLNPVKWFTDSAGFDPEILFFLWPKINKNAADIYPRQFGGVFLNDIILRL